MKKYIIPVCVLGAGLGFVFMDIFKLSSVTIASYLLISGAISIIAVKFAGGK